ncbi:MAG: hypothetical protein ACYSWU_00135 [Planctomycetota bacterium]|jgi:hypothetical protein
MPSCPPGFRRAIRLFEDFHAYDVKDAKRLPSSVAIPTSVYYAGPCVYVTYRSDKWKDGTHDYVHDIESFPRVVVGLVGQKTSRKRRVPKRICDNTTLVGLNKKALGFGYRGGDGELVDATAAGCKWYWHPQGKALLLIRNRRKLVAIIWGGELDWKPQGLVG